MDVPRLCTMKVSVGFKLSDLRKKKRLSKRKQDRLDKHYLIKYSRNSKYCKPVKTVVPAYSKKYKAKIEAEVLANFEVPECVEENIRCQYFKPDKTIKYHTGSVHKIF